MKISSILMILAALLTCLPLPAEAGRIVVRNLTRRTYFCTIQSEGALHPQAEAFIFPGDTYEWHPPRGSGQIWRVSVIHDDNGMSAGAPARARIEGPGGELTIQEDAGEPGLRMADNIPAGKTGKTLQ